MEKENLTKAIEQTTACSAADKHAMLDTLKQHTAARTDYATQLLEQAAAARKAISEAADNGCPNAATDSVIINVDNKQFILSLAMADVLGYFAEFLSAVEDFAAEEIQYINSSK